ncbi:hypothetical protein BDW75DRAFT_214656 [Aspergillus navahoensis]
MIYVSGCKSTTRNAWSDLPGSHLHSLHAVTIKTDQKRRLRPARQNLLRTVRDGLIVDAFQQPYWVGNGACQAVLFDDMIELIPSRMALEAVAGSVVVVVVVVAWHGLVKVVVIFAI